MEPGLLWEAHKVYREDAALVQWCRISKWKPTSCEPVPESYRAELLMQSIGEQSKTEPCCDDG